MKEIGSQALQDVSDRVEKGYQRFFDYIKDKKAGLHPRRHLTVSTTGFKEGDFTMVLGYPGTTSRYASSEEMHQDLEVERPILNRLQGRQMEIVRRWMDRDPLIRMKYSNAFFNLSNVAELQQGEAACARRFRTIEKRRAQEALMPDRALLDTLKAEYAAISHDEVMKLYYRECLVRGLYCAPVFLRLGAARGNLEREREIILKGLREIDPRAAGPFAPVVPPPHGRAFPEACPPVFKGAIRHGLERHGRVAVG